MAERVRGKLLAHRASLSNIDVEIFAIATLNREREREILFSLDGMVRRL